MAAEPNIPQPVNALAMLTGSQSVNDFLDQIYGRKFHVFDGAADRFDTIFGWDALDTILRHHRLEFPRFRLFKYAQLVSSDSYTDEIHLRRGPSIRRLRACNIMELMREGVTFSLDDVDELSDPIRDLAMGLEHALREHVRVNAYASWGPERGLDLHWDDHDVFALQIAGSKRWQITAPTRQWPLRRDVVQGPAPWNLPTAEIVLKAGDVLYIPRGWWHVAEAAESASLHLTAGFNPRTGIDLLEWLVDRLRNVDVLRQDLPRFADRQTRKLHTGRIRDAFLASIEESDVGDDFFGEQDGLEPARQGFGLSSTPNVLNNPPGESIVTLLVSRPLLTSTEKEVVLLANGERWRLSASASPMLRQLLNTSPTTLNELYATISEDVTSKHAVLKLVQELVLRGVAMLEPPPVKRANLDESAIYSQYRCR